MLVKKIGKEKMLQRKRRVPLRRWNSPFLKQFQLLAWGIGLLRLGAIKQLYVAELLVGDAHDAYLAKLWQYGFYSLFMNFRILHAGTMTDIDGKLKHGEAILYQTLAEQRVFTDVFLRLCWQVEQY